MSFRVLSQELAEKLSRVRIIPVLSFHSAEESLRLGEILVEGGFARRRSPFGRRRRRVPSVPCGRRIRSFAWVRGRC